MKNLNNKNGFLKKLKPNDVGKRGGGTGSHQAAIHIGKGQKEYFPSLDESISNPECLVTINDEKEGYQWKFRFIYYNSKKLKRELETSIVCHL